MRLTVSCIADLAGSQFAIGWHQVAFFCIKVSCQAFTARAFIASKRIGGIDYMIV
jgi:hypothetical protein